jgi:hypothetical protein
MLLRLATDTASEEEEENLTLSYAPSSGSGGGGGLVVDLTSAGHSEDDNDDSDNDVEYSHAVSGVASSFSSASPAAAFYAHPNLAPAKRHLPEGAHEEAAKRARAEIFQRQQQFQQQQQFHQQQQQQHQPQEQHQPKAQAQVYRLYGQEFTFAVQSHKAVECKWTGTVTPSQVAIGCVNAFLAHYANQEPLQFW